MESRHFPSHKDQWVCPNDRQLALRAKLHTGWSVKSSRLSVYGRSKTLNEEEMEKILYVIKKAENLELAEQKRIGYLVDRLESVKKSSKGTGINQCALCGEQFRFLASSGQLCGDCNKVQCEKCIVNVVTSKKETIWLCKLCAEYREVWKKSGAWFFKSLPKFVLPTRKHSADATLRKEKKLHRQYNSWTSSAVSCKESNTDESSNEDASYDCSSVLTRSSTMKSSLSQKIHEDDVYNSIGAQDEIVRVVQSASSRRKDSSLSSVDSLEFKNSIEDIIDPKIELRKTSVHSLPDDAKKNVFFPSKSRAGGSLGNTSNSFYKSLPTELTIGSLEFSIEYSYIDGSLRCNIFRGKSLVFNKNHSPSGSTVYVELSMPVGPHSQRKLRTKAVRGADPEFGETLTFQGIDEREISTKILKLCVKDEEKDKVMGEIKLPLNRMRNNHKRLYNMDLEPVTLVQECSHLDKRNIPKFRDRGRILLSLKYSTARNSLIVGIVRCANLMPRDLNGLSDPFVKVQLKPDPLNRKFKTSTKWKTLNPEFNEEFVFEIKLIELPRKTLEITVWDKDYMKKDYLGGIQLGIDSRKELLRHWFETLKNPNRRHDRWHLLSSELFMDPLITME